jgi:hypothetical protein
MRAAESNINRVALAVFHYFDRIGRVASYGRVISPR